KAVVPGKSGETLMIVRVTHADPKKRMPPKGPALSDKEIATLRAWIDQGAIWQEGFSFAGSGYLSSLKPRRPEVPPAREGLANPIDRFLVGYYERHKVASPALVDDAMFGRRIYLDVIGLLPRPEQLDAFLADPSADKRQ